MKERREESLIRCAQLVRVVRELRQQHRSRPRDHLSSQREEPGIRQSMAGEREREREREAPAVASVDPAAGNRENGVRAQKKIKDMQCTAEGCCYDCPGKV